MQIRSHANAEIVFEHFAGECFNNDDQLVIIVQLDDEGCVCEDVDGEEMFYNFYELNVDNDTYNEILEIKQKV